MNRYLILAGTEKSGTTSVYQYLSAHPGIVSSVRKETDYFRSTPPHDIYSYDALFATAASEKVRMEASPGYLAESDVTAPAMAALLPQARVIFVLRDPIDRLLSGFDFHKSRFHIPGAMSFDAYIDLCMQFERGEISLAEAGLNEWHLRVPDAGRYAAHLADYYACFPREQILVTTLDSLQRDPAAFMRRVCEWAGLDAAFYEDYAFVRANVTFAPRRAWLQKVGLQVNNALEPFFNRNPGVKQWLLGWYKHINGKRVDKPFMASATARLLIDYYSPDIENLLSIVGEEVSDARSWLRKHHVS